MNELIVNNQVSVIGEIVTPFTYSHDVYGEGFYMLDLDIARQNGIKDRIPVMVSERLIDVSQDYRGEYIEVTGQFRSFNKYDGEKSRLLLSVFAREILFVEEEVDESRSNVIELEGYLCKSPVYRKTPLGREIADLLLAVNRPYGKSDYIPCICWGRNARFASLFTVGEHVRITGRIQSRKYMKKISDTEKEERTAYEVSIQLITAWEN